MSLSLKEAQTLKKISKFLYEFLPGEAHPYTDQLISFIGVATELNLDKFCYYHATIPSAGHVKLEMVY